jgi:hypothetical protein
MSKGDGSPPVEPLPAPGGRLRLPGKDCPRELRIAVVNFGRRGDLFRRQAAPWMIALLNRFLTDKRMAPVFQHLQDFGLECIHWQPMLLTLVESAEPLVSFRSPEDRQAQWERLRDVHSDIATLAHGLMLALSEAEELAADTAGIFEPHQPLRDAINPDVYLMLARLRAGATSLEWPALEYQSQLSGRPADSVAADEMRGREEKETGQVEFPGAEVRRIGYYKRRIQAEMKAGSVAVRFVGGLLHEVDRLSVSEGRSFAAAIRKERGRTVAYWFSDIHLAAVMEVVTGVGAAPLHDIDDDSQTTINIVLLNRAQKKHRDESPDWMQSDCPAGGE